MRRINLQLFGLIVNTKVKDTGSTPRRYTDNDAYRNIYNNIMNNGGTEQQARHAVANYSQGKAGNYYVSDNAYKTSAYFDHKGQYYDKEGNNVTDLYNLDKLLGGNYSFKGIGGIGKFTPSQAYTDAMNLTNSLLSQLTSGRTAYSDKVDALMSKIENREKFSYDFNKDPLFQNALASAMSSGQTAMQDTMGQAAALTGGYGSSYATSAANQAYNDFVKGAYEQLPQYYQLARDTYNQEGQELYNQLGMYQTADNTAYGRLSDAYSANLANAQNMWNQEYSNYWDTANYNLSAAKYNADLKYKYDSLNADQKAALAKSYSSASGNGSGTSSGGAGVSNTLMNSFKSDLDKIAKSSPLSGENYLLQLWDNNPDITDGQMREITAYWDSIKPVKGDWMAQARSAARSKTKSNLRTNPNTKYLGQRKKEEDLK